MATHVVEYRGNPELLTRFCDYVTKQGLIADHDRVLAAVSGGKDSVAMLDLLHRYFEGDPTRLGVVYVNHGWDPKRHELESAFVREMASRLSLPFHARKIRSLSSDKRRSESLEAWSRRERYRLLLETLVEGGYTLCAIGHTADDQAETVLMRLLKGSGLWGLSGIPVRREFYIRPMMGFTTGEILDYLRFRRLEFVEDPTNRDMRRLRARIRHQLLPTLEHNLNPEVKQALVDLSQDVGELRSKVTTELASPIHAEKGKIILAEGPFFSYLDIIRKIWLQEALQKASGALYPLRRHHMESVSRLSGNGKTGKWVALPGGFRLLRDRDRLILLPMSATGNESIPISLGQNSCRSLGVEFVAEEFPLESAAFSTDPAVEWMDYDRLPSPWILRRWKAGDRFRPLGAPGTKKISDFLIDQKISEDEKARVLVLEVSGEIVWVVGHRISEIARITASTKRVVRCEVRRLDRAD